MARDSLIRFRRGNQTEWLAINNPNGAVLAAGEPGFDSVNNLLKVGDGTTPWSSLSPVNSGISGGGIGNIVEDTTPQLGGNLDLNSNDITGTGDFNIIGSGIITETMDNHCGFIIKSSGNTNGELHVGSCGDANGVPNAMGLRHSSMDGGNDFMICANTDGATFVSAKDLKTLELTAGGRDAGVKLQLNEAYGFKFNENKQADVDLQYQGDNDTNLFFIDASADSVGIGTNAPTQKLDVNSSGIRIRDDHTPASASASGNKGDIVWDSNYVYICISTNTWKRAALSTW